MPGRVWEEFNVGEAIGTFVSVYLPVAPPQEMLRGNDATELTWIICGALALVEEFVALVDRCVIENTSVDEIVGCVLE